MSYQASVAFVQQYSTNVSMLLQQMGTRFRSTVTEQAFMGKAASVVEQFGAVTPVRNLPRHAATPLISTPQDKRWAYPNDYHWADMIDDVDKVRELINPQSNFVEAGVNAMGRAIDDEILFGIYNSNNTGDNGTLATGLLSAFNAGSQVVAANVGASSATGLNVAKLRAARQILEQADIDLDRDEIYLGVSARQMNDIRNEVQAINSEYIPGSPLSSGKMPSVLGFNLIHSERVAGAANFNAVINPAVTGYTTGSQWLLPFWVKSGVKLGVWNDIKTSVDRRPDRLNAT